MKFWTTLILIACVSLWSCSTIHALRSRAAQQINQRMTETGSLPTLRDEIPAGMCVGFTPHFIRQE